MMRNVRKCQKKEEKFRVKTVHKQASVALILQNLEHVMIEPLFLVFLSSPAGFRGASSKEGTSAQIQSSRENP